MGSYENIIKIEEMRKKVEEGDMETAQKILDTMDIKKIRNILDLNLIAEVYTGNGKYEEAKELYLRIYERTHTRKSLYNLLNIIIKLNDVEEAQYYYKQYEQIAPNDFYNYIFRYYIEKMKGATYESLIDILEKLKKQEYIEEWAYQLAKLYYKAGMEEKCIRECSDIILWFGEGPYVEKARILRSYYLGETDKEKIMQEIKHRAETIGTQSADDAVNDAANSNNISAKSSDTADESNADESNDTADESNFHGDEEAAYINQNFADDSSDNLEYNLKLDVQNFMDDDSSKYDDELSKNNDTVRNEQYIEENTKSGQSDNSSDEYDLLGWLKKEHKIDVYDIFADFFKEDDVKPQLKSSLENILLEDSNNIMMLITGSSGSGKTTLAKKLALFLNYIGKLPTSKLAKVNADKLNTIDIFTKKDLIKGCCLVIENASSLTQDTLDRVLELSNELPSELAVVFEENKENIDKLLMEHPALNDLIKNRVNLL